MAPSRNWARLRTAAAALALAIGLSACADGRLPWTSRSIVQPCPDYRVLADAARLTRFRPGPGRDLTDIDFEVQVVDVLLGCETDVSKKTLAGEMEVDVALAFAVARGPANRTRSADFAYFISVTDLNKKVLYREEFGISAVFPGNRSRRQVNSEPIILQLPLSKELDSKKYLIFAGLKLTRDELRFNRSRRTGTLP